MFGFNLKFAFNVANDNTTINAIDFICISPFSALSFPILLFKLESHLSLIHFEKKSSFQFTKIDIHLNHAATDHLRYNSNLILFFE